MRRTILACFATAAVTHAQAFAAALVPATPEITAAASRAIGCPALAPTRDGGAIVVFTDVVPPAGHHRVHSRYSSRDGARAAVRVLSPPLDVIASAGAVALASGDILVHWLDFGTYSGSPRARYRLLDSVGRPLGPARTAAELRDVGQIPDIGDLDAVALGDDAVIIWKRGGRFPMAMRVNPRAALSERPRRLEGTSRSSIILAVGSLGEAGLVVAWEELASGGNEIQARAFGEDLEPLGGSSRIASRPRRSHSQRPVRVAGRHDRFVVVWSVVTGGDELAGFRHAALQRMFGVNGEPLGPIRVVDRGFLVGDLGVDEEGSFVVAGATGRVGRTDAAAVLHSADGVASGDPLRLHRPSARAQECPAIVSGPENQWWAAWQDFDLSNGSVGPAPDPIRQIRLRRFTRQD